ncbi:MAG: response regulator [Nitrospirae bacterium]|nr:response regulator [Nitrospirota bacterium]
MYEQEKNNTVKVLLIEDDPLDVRYLKKLLSDNSSSDIYIDHADRLNKGIDLVNNSQTAYSVVLLDLGLPDTLGSDTFARAYKSFPHIPIIILSGCCDDEVVFKSLREGAQDYLVKGQINRDILIRTIRYAIERHELIIKRQKAEDDLKELNQRLEQKIQEELKNLHQKEQLLIQQSKMASMGEMLAMIAHQWKQPLNAIGILAQDIKDAYEYGDLNSEYIENLSKDIMQQILYMSNTIDDFRNFLKPSKNKTIFKLNSTLIDVILMLYKILEKSNINILLKCNYKEATERKTFKNITEICSCEPSIFVEGYQNEFKQVIVNLIQNARDSIISKKEDTSSVKGNIAIELNIINNRATVSIIDNGSGIPVDIQEKMFEPYFTTKGEDKGTGIGLYMAKTIIEKNMGGSISFKNTGNGAVFMIELDVVCLK